MRIIGGNLKGRRLKGFDRNLSLRPMTDRVKESLFATLTPFFHKKPKVFRFIFRNGKPRAGSPLQRSQGSSCRGIPSPFP